MILNDASADGFNDLNLNAITDLGDYRYEYQNAGSDSPALKEPVSIPPVVYLPPPEPVWTLPVSDVPPIAITEPVNPVWKPPVTTPTPIAITEPLWTPPPPVPVVTSILPTYQLPPTPTTETTLKPAAPQTEPLVHLPFIPAITISGVPPTVGISSPTVITTSPLPRPYDDVPSLSPVVNINPFSTSYVPAVVPTQVRSPFQDVLDRFHLLKDAADAAYKPQTADETGFLGSGTEPIVAQRPTRISPTEDFVPLPSLQTPPAATDLNGIRTIPGKLRTLTEVITSALPPAPAPADTPMTAVASLLPLLVVVGAALYWMD